MNEKAKIFLIPVSIVLAGVIVAGAVIYNGSGISLGTGDKQLIKDEKAQMESALAVASGLTKINDQDHYLGNPKAMVQIVEFSDMDCPYCQRFSKTINQVVSAYGDKIGVVYRHLPLSFHQNAKREAEATECASILGGNDAFWKYFTKYEENIASGKKFSEGLLATTAQSVGLDKTKFQTCLAGTEATKLVEADMAEASAIGVQVTPFSIILKEGKVVDLIPGSFPFEDQAVDSCDKASIYIYSLRNKSCSFKSILDKLTK